MYFLLTVHIISSSFAVRIKKLIGPHMASRLQFSFACPGYSGEVSALSRDRQARNNADGGRAEDEVDGGMEGEEFRGLVSFADYSGFSI